MQHLMHVSFVSLSWGLLRLKLALLQLTIDRKLPCSILGQKATLAISPTSGTIPPHSGQTVHLTFAPESEGPINCNLIFKIRGKSAPLAINVKGGGSAIRARLEAELGGRSLELSQTAVNDVDFGQVLLDIFGFLSHEQSFFIRKCGLHPIFHFKSHIQYCIPLE
jgi:hypothetical protein